MPPRIPAVPGRAPKNSQLRPRKARVAATRNKLHPPSPSSPSLKSQRRADQRLSRLVTPNLAMSLRSPIHPMRQTKPLMEIQVRLCRTWIQQYLVDLRAQFCLFNRPPRLRRPRLLKTETTAVKKLLRHLHPIRLRNARPRLLTTPFRARNRRPRQRTDLKHPRRGKTNRQRGIPLPILKPEVQAARQEPGARRANEEGGGRNRS